MDPCEEIPADADDPGAVDEAFLFWPAPEFSPLLGPAGWAFKYICRLSRKSLALIKLDITYQKVQ